MNTCDELEIIVQVGSGLLLYLLLDLPTSETPNIFQLQKDIFEKRIMSS